MTVVDDPARAQLLRRGLRLEHVTLGWNVVGERVADQPQISSAASAASAAAW